MFKRRGLPAVVRIGNPVLRQAVSVFSDEEIRSDRTTSLVRSMMRVMDSESNADSNAVGLAAPQIGLARALLVVRSSDNTCFVPATAMFNPKVEVLSSDKVTMAESCLSVPGMVGLVRRAARVAVHFQDEEAKKRVALCDGWVAGLLQHEIDHLHGTLFVDKVEPKELCMVDEWNKFVFPRVHNMLVKEGSFKLQ